MTTLLYLDPEISYRRLVNGNPQLLTSLIDALPKVSKNTETASTYLKKSTDALADTWDGKSADGFAKQSAMSLKAARSAQASIALGQGIISMALTEYANLKAAADNAMTSWRDRPAALDSEQTQALVVNTRRALGEVENSFAKRFQELATQLRDIPQEFTAASKLDPSWHSKFCSPPSAHNIPEISADPRSTAKWWSELTAEQRESLLDTEFQKLGQLSGLPADVLHEANSKRIDDDITTTAAKQSELADQMSQRARALRLDPNNSSDQKILAEDDIYQGLLAQQQAVAAKADSAAKAHKSLTEAQTKAADKGWNKTDVRIMAYDPSGEGRMAIAFGNPDTARNVAVCVPGTGTSLDDLSLNQAINLREQMSEHGNATIQWLGYDAPKILPGEVDDPTQAKLGGHNLVADVNGYRAAAEQAGNSPHLTVIGHSYGSTTLGYAAMNGLAADDIAFVGSPGVGASHVSQLSPGNGHVFVGTNEHDAVSRLNWYTEGSVSRGPYDPDFGATQFGVQSGNSVLSAHTSYFDQDSESLNNLAKIANGQAPGLSNASNYIPADQLLSKVPIVGQVADRAMATGYEIAEGAQDWIAGHVTIAADLAKGDFESASRNTVAMGKEAINDVIDVGVTSLGGAVQVAQNAVEFSVEVAGGFKKAFDKFF